MRWARSGPPALNAVETRFKLPPDQVNLLISAGRDALAANPTFIAFMKSLPRGPRVPSRCHRAFRRGRQRRRYPWPRKLEPHEARAN